MTAINKQGLPWKAMLKGEFEGRTVGSFGTGLKHLPEEVRRRRNRSIAHSNERCAAHRAAAMRARAAAAAHIRRGLAGHWEPRS